ncbi:MAG: hypothetical protein ACRBF0_20050 [Calditrichia bacterium]
MRKLQNNLWAQLLIIYTRYLIGGAFLFASMIKIMGGRFTTDSGADAPINSAWHFFETLYQSGLYWQFIGMGQLVAAFFLMTQRYSKLGALMFLPIISNIFVVTISYDFRGTPIITGLMLLANLMLLLWEWDELKILFNKEPVLNQKSAFEMQRCWEVTGLLLFLFTVVFRSVVGSYNIFIWIGVSLLVGLAGLVWGLRGRKH